MSEHYIKVWQDTAGDWHGEVWENDHFYDYFLAPTKEVAVYRANNYIENQKRRDAAEIIVPEKTT